MNKTTAVTTQASNGASSAAINPIYLRGRHADGNTTAQPRDRIAVIDSITFSYDNTPNLAAALIDIQVIANGTSFPIWRGIATVPAGEVITIDKDFPTGLPLWVGYDITTTTGDTATVYSGGTGAPAQSATTSAAIYGTVSALIDGTAWVGGANGQDQLTVLWHTEITTNRRN